MKKTVFIIISVISFYQAQAQWYWLHNYLYADQNGVYSIAFQQDNLWLAMNNGFEKYDIVSGVIQRYNYVDFPQAYSYYGAFRSTYTDPQGAVYVNYYSYNNGLLKYDGINWTDYPVAGLSNSFWGSQIISDSQNKLWMMKGNILAGFNGAVWDTFQSSQLYNSSDVNIAMDKNDTIWILGQSKLLKFHDGIFELVLSGISGSSLVIDSSENKWIGKYNALYRINGSDVDTFNNTNSPINFDPSVMCIDTAGILVIVKGQEKLFFFDGTNWSSVSLPAASSYQIIHTIVCDQANTLWLGSNHSTVYKYQNGQWTEYIAGFDGLITTNFHHITSFEPYLFINALAATDEALLGISQENSALFLYDSTNSPLTTNNITCLAKSLLGTFPQQQWIGTTEGFFKWNLAENTWKHYTTSNSMLPNDTVNDIVKWDDTNGWIATNGGLAKMENDSIVTVYTASNSGLLSDKIQCLSPVYDFSLPLYIGTDAGVAVFENNSWTTITTSNSGLPDNDITAVLSYSGTTYYGTRSHGVADSNSTGWHYHNTGIDLPSDSITFIAEGVLGPLSGTKILIGTKGGGLLTFDGDNYEGATNEADGISFSNANDYSGNTTEGVNLSSWIATDEGILLHAYIWGSSTEQSSSVYFSAYFQNDELHINYETEYAKTVTADLFDLLGRRLLHVKLPRTSGKAQVSFKTQSLSPGVYILNLSNGNHQQAIKVFKSN